MQLDYESYRLVVRDVARNTDERTMMATILPPNVYCPHTVSMEVVFHDELAGKRLKLKAVALSKGERLSLAAVFNSLVVDYQLRQMVNAHLSIFYLHQLPIPRLTSAEFDDLLREVFGPKATHRTHGATEEPTRRRLHAELDALVAQLYALTEEEFTHILATYGWPAHRTRQPRIC
jgi:hypothetical protein